MLQAAPVCLIHGFSWSPWSAPATIINIIKHAAIRTTSDHTSKLKKASSMSPFDRHFSLISLERSWQRKNTHGQKNNENGKTKTKRWSHFNLKTVQQCHWSAQGCEGFASTDWSQDIRLPAQVLIKTATVLISRGCFVEDGTKLFCIACRTCGMLN